MQDYRELWWSEWDLNLQPLDNHATMLPSRELKGETTKNKRGEVVFAAEDRIAWRKRPYSLIL